MNSRLITPELEKTLASYPLYSQDDKKKDAICVCTFGIGNVRWYVLEAEKQENGDYTFFGIVTGLYETEYGYFTLAELEELEIGNPPFLMRVNTVQPISQKPIGTIPDMELQEFLNRIHS